MIRLPHLIAAGLVLGAASPAVAQGLRAEFAAPFERASDVVIDGKVWSCAGTACTARGDDPRPAIACRKVARKLGAVTRFATPRSELNAAELASCNQDRG